MHRMKQVVNWKLNWDQDKRQESNPCSAQIVKRNTAMQWIPKIKVVGFYLHYPELLGSPVTPQESWFKEMEGSGGQRFNLWYQQSNNIFLLLCHSKKGTQSTSPALQSSSDLAKLIDNRCPLEIKYEVYFLLFWIFFLLCSVTKGWRIFMSERLHE